MGSRPPIEPLLGAVKELDLSYHNMDIYQIAWFWDYGNLSSLTETQFNVSHIITVGLPGEPFGW